MKLHAYQELGRDFLLNTPRAGLFMDMGLGKTATTLSALTPAHLPAIVVAPKRVAEEVWPAEHQLWRPDLSIALAVGDPPKRRKALDAKANLTVISRDNLKDLSPGGYNTYILDESSGFKDRSTNRWKLARKLTAHVPHVWELTGTPSPNGLLDLWAQIFLLDGGERLTTGISHYRARYFMPTMTNSAGVIIDWEIREGAEQHIYELIDDICLSMASEDHIKLPDVTHNTIEVTLPPQAKSAYKELAKELVVNLEMLGGEVHSASNAAVLTGKLSQITAGFIYSDTGDGTFTPLHQVKIEALREVVEGTGSPVLVFYHFREEQEMLRRAFPQACGLDDPHAIAQWNNGEVPMLLAHPASAAHGLNLQHGGHTIVWMTQTWSLELYEQANARLSRQGQKNPVVIHTIQAKGTVDKVIADRLVGKKFQQDALLEHLSSPL